MRAPKYFRSALSVTSVTLSMTRPQFVKPSIARGKFKAGLVYEDLAWKEIADRHPQWIQPRYWFRFDDGRSEGRWCQPDIILVDSDRKVVYIGEVKIKHCARAWFQLHELYLPVIRHFYGADYEYRLFEMTKSFDIATPFPAPVEHIRDVRDCRLPPQTNILRWRPA